mmetsp:Transcript_37216/g.148536  ORF Transcript_37216/g.148536 Transcript_37216/m.148536 type:complete len:357 (-) Transcript_37216:871-1941(-)
MDDSKLGGFINSPFSSVWRTPARPSVTTRRCRRMRRSRVALGGDEEAGVQRNESEKGEENQAPDKEEIPSDEKVSKEKEGANGLPADFGADNPLFSLLNQFKPSELVSRFEESTASEVNTAFRSTLRKLLGSMPSTVYGMSVRTIVGNLVSIMQTCIMTGYLMRNAQYRLSLTRKLDSAQSMLPNMPSNVKVKGGQAILTLKDGTIKEVSAEDYVSELKSEAQALRDELNRLKKGGPASGNELAMIFASYDQKQVEILTREAGSEATAAMKLLIQNVLGTKADAVDPMIPIETTRDDLGTAFLQFCIGRTDTTPFQCRACVPEACFAGDGTESSIVSVLNGYIYYPLRFFRTTALL